MSGILQTGIVEIRQFVDGRWGAGGGAAFERRDPTHPDVVLARGWESSAADALAAVASARKAQRAWAAHTPHARADVLRRAGVLIAARADDLGRELAREEGKTLPEGIGEVRRAAQILEYAAGEPDRVAGEVYHSPRAGERILVSRRPLGVVAVIAPFNFPIAIPAWKIAPALVHGNAVVFKASGAVPILAMRLVEALVEAGLPDGVLHLLHGDGEAGRTLVQQGDIDAVSFTGSTVVGRSIAATAAGRGIPAQAEMGGKNAAVVLDDADLDLAVAQVVAGAFASSGQKCTATSRLLVQEGVAEEFLTRLAAAADALPVGDPLAPGTRLGPLVSAAARQRVLDGVAAATAAGGRVLTTRDPGVDLDGGHFVAPTIVHLDGDAELWREELFGPVLAVRTVPDAETAFALVDDSPYGLSAAVFTRDLATALAAVERLDVGMVHINSETAGADPHVPFGGVKASSLGPGEQGSAAREFYTRPSTAYIRG